MKKGKKEGVSKLPMTLKEVDVIRCPQIGNEMVQWMRMYVSKVRCETGENGSCIGGDGDGVSGRGNERRGVVDL